MLFFLFSNSEIAFGVTLRLIFLGSKIHGIAIIHSFMSYLFPTRHLAKKLYAFYFYLAVAFAEVYQLINNSTAFSNCGSF